MGRPSVYPPVRIDDTFTHWTVIGPAERRIAGDKSFKQWLCRCDCGVEKPVDQANLLQGASKSCGCLQRRAASQAKRTHGATTGDGRTPEYEAWLGIIRRCYDPKVRNFSNYGGRGITVCDRWRFGEDGKGPFDCFLEDVGLRPSSGHSLDRWPDNNAGYEPQNVRWATRAQQNRNTRRNRPITFDGKTMTVMDWAAHLRLAYSAIYKRLDAGWSVERTLTTPVREMSPRK